MPKFRKAGDNTAVLDGPEGRPEFLADGHPNPEFYLKDGDGFEAFQAALDAKSLWGDYFGKLYRIKPLRHTDEKPPRLEKFASSITLDYIRKTYGGRKYTAYMTRRLGTKELEPLKFQFDIEAAPIYHDDEGSESTAGGAVATATDTAQTQMFAMMERLMNDTFRRLDEANKKGEKNSSSAEILVEASKQAIDLVKQQATQRNGFDLAGIVALVTPLVPLATPFIERLLKPADPMEQVKQLAAIKEMFKEIAQEKSGFDWNGLAGALAPLGDGLGRALMMFLARQQPGAAPPAAIQPGVAPWPAQPPAAPQRGPQAVPMPGAPAAPAPEPTDPQTIEIPESVVPQIVGDQVLHRIMAMMKAGAHGGDAALVCETMYPALAQDLCGLLKAGDITTLSQRYPTLAEAASQPNVLQFAGEFVDYFEPPPQAENGAQPA